MFKLYRHFQLLWIQKKTTEGEEREKRHKCTMRAVKFALFNLILIYFMVNIMDKLVHVGSRSIVCYEAQNKWEEIVKKKKKNCVHIFLSNGGFIGILELVANMVLRWCHMAFIMWLFFEREKGTCTISYLPKKPRKVSTKANLRIQEKIILGKYICDGSW